MHINDLDLNLLRVFDAVYRARSVSRAAETLGLSQPATSQALMRLRLLIKDALFVRASGGVQPTPKADRLAQAVQSAIATIEAALDEEAHFDPAQSQMTLRLHLSDIGEGRFLPGLMAALHTQAPGVRVQSMPVPHADIAGSLDSGSIDFAIGFLPQVRGTQQIELITDRYIVLLRNGHPLVSKRRRPAVDLEALEQLEYVAVRSHSETLRILQLLRLEHRLRLTASHFLALPAIVRMTDLGVVMPLEIAHTFCLSGEYAIIEPPLPQRDFSVSLHWSRRFESDPVHRWMAAFLVRLFKHDPPTATRGKR